MSTFCDNTTFHVAVVVCRRSFFHSFLFIASAEIVCRSTTKSFSVFIFTRTLSVRHWFWLARACVCACRHFGIIYLMTSVKFCPWIRQPPQIWLILTPAEATKATRHTGETSQHKKQIIYRSFSHCDKTQRISTYSTSRPSRLFLRNA